jgi:TRAP-type C4-dicarboxylate transport system permease small subunit
VWLTMLSGYVGVRRNIHMAVDFVIVKWPPRWRKAVSLGGLAASAGFTAVLAWQALPVIESMEGMNFVALDLGQTWMYWSVPVGAVLMLVAFAAEALRRLASPDGR